MGKRKATRKTKSKGTKSKIQKLFRYDVKISFKGAKKQRKGIFMGFVEARSKRQAKKIASRRMRSDIHVHEAFPKQKLKLSIKKSKS